MYNDPGIINLAKAIRQKESGNNPNVTSHITNTEGSVGAYQFLPETFKSYGSKYLGGKDLNGGDLDIHNPEHQNLVAYKYIEDKKNQGYGIDQIAASWNAGEGALNDYQNRVGTNKYGNSYNVPKYANDVVTLYNQFKQGTPQTQPIPEAQNPYPESPLHIGNAQKTLDAGKSILGGILGASARLGQTVGAGVTAGLKTLFGDQPFSQNYQDATQMYQKSGNVLGNKLFGESVQPAQNPMQVAGDTAMTAATLFPLGRIAEGATGAAKLGLNTLEGGLVGGTYSGGQTAQEGGDFGQIAASGATGAGLGAVLGGLPGAISGTKNFVKGRPIFEETTQDIINNRRNELQKIVDSNAGLRKVTGKAAERNLNTVDDLANSDLLVGAVDDTGTIRTQNAVSELNKFIKPQEDVVRRVIQKEGKSVSPDYVLNRLKRNVDEEGLKGAAKIRAYNEVENEIKGLKLEANPEGLLPVEVLHDAKVDKYANINYLNPESKRLDKAIARTYKQIVEDHTPDANMLNKELSKYYTMQELLETLDGKKAEGGRLGKHFSKVLGGMVGGHVGGPIGAIAGAETAGALKGVQLKNTFGKNTGAALESTPFMKQTLKNSTKPVALLGEPSQSIEDIYSSIGRGKAAGKAPGFANVGTLVGGAGVLSAPLIAKGLSKVGQEEKVTVSEEDKQKSRDIIDRYYNNGKIDMNKIGEILHDLEGSKGAADFSGYAKVRNLPDGTKYDVGYAKEYGLTPVALQELIRLGKLKKDQLNSLLKSKERTEELAATYFNIGFNKKDPKVEDIVNHYFDQYVTKASPYYTDDKARNSRRSLIRKYQK